ncbi:FecR family protein [Aquimarina algicola]|uniref:DUF4974 domain-containing protein n=1 Tax=Aquimarina algicola TaxID=2589995 RepID=A0A504IYG4_9FLAO|nr:FecR domain-containing protein [Aquimarina algicola]TPN83516.1 DUF4974 domain-containing protein [Aquimarina algicola]
MLTEEEKKKLKFRINTSVSEYRIQKKKKRIRNWMGAAAAIIVVVFSLNYIQLNNVSELKKYVDNTTMDFDKEKDIKLVFNKDEEVKIEEDTSLITYSNTGSNVKVNNKELTQSSKDNFNTVIVPYGKRTQITLAEGTKVWINSGSRLTYPVVFNGDKREVFLEGEAIFDVTHDKNKPFFVVTKEYDVKVLGTVFNVSSYHDDAHTSTALKEGSVEIKYQGNSIFGKSSLKITPGTLAVYDNKNKTLKSKKVDVSKYMSWRDGKFIFKKQEMNVIIKKLSRYYNTKIEIKNNDLKKQTFSGHLDLKESIEKVLEVLKQSTDLEYKIEDKQIVIN